MSEEPKAEELKDGVEKIADLVKDNPDVLNDLVYALNPIRFAQRLGVDPDEWQKELLLSNASRIILNCSRQSGKSTIVAILALHHSLYRKKALTLVVSPSERQSKELFSKIVEFYRDLRLEKEGQIIESETENKHELALKNKSRIISLPSKPSTLRGYSSPSLILIDEAAQCQDELYEALMPMLAVSKGRLILLSTPFGKSGFFYDVWSKEGSDWESYKITAEQCPRISKDWLAETRRTTSAWSFMQEYMCSFEADETSFFDHDELKRALSSDVTPIKVRINIEPRDV
ncbi:MAG: terminase large subunit domain-containing protein [Halobacteriota archaeon]